MSRVTFSTEADLDIIRFSTFLEPRGMDIADEAIDTIYASLAMLEDWPLSGVPIPSRKSLRKFVINYGDSGYIAFYKYFKESDTAVIAKMFHQNEKYTKTNLRKLRVAL